MNGTNDPFKICAKQKIVVISETLGKIRGYYHEIEGVKMIHINENQSEIIRTIILCNLLYAHFRGKKYMLIGDKCKDSFEKDANIFAFALMNPKIDCSIDYLFHVFRSANVEVEQWVQIMMYKWKQRVS